MSTFQKPSTGSITKKDNNVLEFSSFKLDNINSPFAGVVTDVSQTDCGGKVKLKHVFNGNTLYSKFCNVSTILVSRGENVNGGEKIGKFGDKPVEYVLSDGGKNLNPKDFFGEVESKKTETNKERTSKSSDYRTEKKRGLTVPQEIAIDAISLPLKMGKDFAKGLISKPWQMLKDLPSNILPKKEGFERDLNEEIERIKSLLK
jgi:hypothetical protein